MHEGASLVAASSIPEIGMNVRFVYVSLALTVISYLSVESLLVAQSDLAQGALINLFGFTLLSIKRIES